MLKINSLKEIISGYKEKYSPKIKDAVFDAKLRLAYLQESIKGVIPKINKEKMSKLEIIANIVMPPLAVIGAAVPGFASEKINVSDYIKDKFSSPLFNLYLSPLGELDEAEKEFIDILQQFPEKKQIFYAKKIRNEGFSQEIIDNMKKDESYMKKDDFSYNQKTFIDSLNSTILHTEKIDVSTANEDVKLALDIIGKYPELFNSYGDYFGKIRSDALMKIIKISHEIEPDTGMTANELIYKYYKVVSVLEKRMNIFYYCKSDGLTGKPMTGPFTDRKLDDKEYNFVKRHLVDIVKKSEANMFGLNLAEPNRINSLPNGLNEIQLHNNKLMEMMSLSKLILPYEMFVLKVGPDGKIGFIDEEAANTYLITNSSILLENTINNQKFAEQYFNELKGILTDANVFKEYLKKATTWSTQENQGFRNNGVYLPGEEDPKESIAYQVSRFLSEKDDWSKLNLAALNMVIGKVREKTKGDSREVATATTYLMGLLGLPSYNIQISNFKKKYAKDGLVHDDVAILIPTETFKLAEQRFGEIVNNKKLVVSPFYFNRPQVEKYFKPVKSIDILSPNNFKTNFVVDRFDSMWFK